MTLYYFHGSFDPSISLILTIDHSRPIFEARHRILSRILTR